MQKLLLLIVCFFHVTGLIAQDTYTIGYDHIDIDVVDPYFFSEYQLPGETAQCGIFDKASSTFYTCDYQTFRYVEEDFIYQTGKACCETIDFDPARYYGTLTLSGIIDSIEWDSLIIHFITDKARLKIKTDEREIDKLYEAFYKEERLGKLNIQLCLKTFDTPKENQLSHNKITEKKVKPKRHMVRIIRF
jgi:hypothetical protein